MLVYLKNLGQLHFLVVEDGMNAVDGLLGLVRRAPLGFLMQDGNQSSEENITKKYIISGKSTEEILYNKHKTLHSACCVSDAKISDSTSKTRKSDQVLHTLKKKKYRTIEIHWKFRAHIFLQWLGLNGGRKERQGRKREKEKNLKNKEREKV